MTQYLLDLQPGLVKVIAAATASGTDRYIHAPHGIHAMQSHTGDWTYAVQDALGSVRAEVDNTLTILGVQHPDPYGNLFEQQGNISLPFAYTGEMRDPIGLQYHRARYLNPSLGTFLSLDPFEGMMQRPLSLNGYLYAGGNPVNLTDASGKCWLNTSSSASQHQQCLEAWVNYASRINLNDPTRRDLMRQEHDYWGYVPYSEFAALWNDNQRRPPLSTDPGGIVLQSALPAVGAISIANPFPGPEDILAGIGLLCVAGLAVIAGGTAIALPQRQPYYFSDTNTQEEEKDHVLPIPIPYERRRDEDDESWFHYTDETGIAEIAATGTIRANTANVVYVTRYLYGKDEVLNALFAGNPAYQGRGDFYVEFVAQNDVIFLPASAAPEATQANEWVYYGSLRLGRHIRYFVYVGPNPF